MYNLIRADLFKLRKSKAIKILIAITTICAITATVMAYLIQQGKLDAKAGNGIIFMFGDTNAMGILGAAVAGILICGDFDNRTIHEAIAGGCSRGQVILSKAVSFFCAIVFILLPYVIIVSIGLGTANKFSMGSVSIGFMHILTTDGGKAFSIAQIWKLVAIMLTLIIVYISQLSICMPFALTFKKPILVVIIYYALTILISNLAAARSSSKMLNDIFNCTPYGGKYSVITLSSGTGDILKPIFVSLIFIIVMLAISFLGFRKSEIK